MLFDLRERQGWKALGYPTWERFIVEEFTMSRRHAHRLLNAYMVERILAPEYELGPIGPTSIPESHARELAPLVNDPDALREVYEQVQVETGGKPTAAAYRGVVQGRDSDPDFADDYVEDVSQEYEDDEDTVADAVADGYVLPPRGLRPARKAWHAALAPSLYERIPPEDVIATAEPKELAQSLGSIERSIGYLGLLLKEGRRRLGHAQLEVVQ
jgi:hypothetical protein